MRSESAAITGNTKKTINQSHGNPGVGSREGLALKLRDMKKSCRRLLLLSLSIASSIQQGGASEPGAQPGQTGASAKHGGVGVGRMMQNGGWCACDGGWCPLRDQLWLWALRVLIQGVAMSESRDEGAVAVSRPSHARVGWARLVGGLR